MHKQLLRELKFLDACCSPYIVEHYGSFLAERDSQIGILMEYAEGGSLDSLVSKMRRGNMRCSEHVLGRIASSVSESCRFCQDSGWSERVKGPDDGGMELSGHPALGVTVHEDMAFDSV